MNPILLIFGPSGVGKSTLADWIEEEFNFLHFNFDNWDSKGVDGNNILKELNDFVLHGVPQPLRSAIDQRLNGKKGAVLTFPSNCIFSVGHINAAEQVQIKTVILYGSKENCLNAFIEREKEINRNLPPAHWHKYNDHIYDGSSVKIEHAPYKMETFQGKGRKSREFFMREIRKRLGLL